MNTSNVKRYFKSNFTNDAIVFFDKLESFPLSGRNGILFKIVRGNESVVQMFVDGCVVETIGNFFSSMDSSRVQIVDFRKHVYRLFERYRSISFQRVLMNISGVPSRDASAVQAKVFLLLTRSVTFHGQETDKEKSKLLKYTSAAIVSVGMRIERIIERNCEHMGIGLYS